MADNRYGYEVKADNWYQWQGQKPPERNTHLTEDEMQEKFAENLANHTCEWKQNGAIVYCDVAEFEHGKNIGIKLRLAGQDENNQPILVPVGPILRSQV